MYNIYIYVYVYIYKYQEITPVASPITNGLVL